MAYEVAAYGGNEQVLPPRRGLQAVIIPLVLAVVLYPHHNASAPWPEGAPARAVSLARGADLR